MVIYNSKADNKKTTEPPSRRRKIKTAKNEPETIKFKRPQYLISYHIIHHLKVKVSGLTLVKSNFRPNFIKIKYG